MKWLNVYRMASISIGVVAAIFLEGGSAKADFTFGEPTNLGPTVNSSTDEYCPCISTDGLELYFHSTHSDGYGSHDIWVTRLPYPNDAWDTPVNLGPAVNSSSYDMTPEISADGLSLFFCSDRPGGLGNIDIWVTTRPTKTHPWGSPANLGPKINTSASDSHPYTSADGLSLYFAGSAHPWDPPRAGGYGGGDIWVSARTTINEEWGEPKNLGATINSSVYDAAPCISADGLMLFFQSNRPGGYGTHDIWVARRKIPDHPWDEPFNLGRPVNSPDADGGPALSGDGKTFYFLSGRAGGSGGWDIWQAPIISIVDFNGDGIVDSADMCIMIDHWGQDDSLCDIGPMPWGDDIVDVQDLIALSEHLFDDVNDPTFVAHWPLDEAQGVTAYDNAGNFDGTLIGDPAWQPDGGMVAGALEFDGIDDYVSTAFVFDTAQGDFSVLLWIKGGAPGQVIISQEGGANWLMADAVNGTLRTDLKQAARTGRGATPAGPPLIGAAVVTDGDWHRVGFVRAHSNRILYVDDVEVGCDTATDLEFAVGGLHIGTGNAVQSGTFFSGLIDDVRIYNRVVHP